jgi:hypothetical protein
MKKIDLGQTFQVLANVGVIIGLIFLTLEIRQNTSALIDESQWNAEVKNIEIIFDAARDTYKPPPGRSTAAR